MFGQNGVPAWAALESAARVCGPTMPSTVIPTVCWKKRIARTVSGPSSPSSGPGLQLRLTSSRWMCSTSLPSPPSDPPSLLGAAVVGVVSCVPSVLTDESSSPPPHAATSSASASIATPSRVHRIARIAAPRPPTGQLLHTTEQGR